MRVLRSTFPMKRTHRPVQWRRMRGFSLIEMVAAFLVFAIGIGVLMNILATSMHSARQSSDYTMAALRAESKLDTVGVGEHIEAGHTSGRFDDDYSWDLDIRQVDPASVEPPPQPAALQAGAASQAMQQAQNRQLTASNAGNGGGIDVAPFDLYQVDLTVSWGGRFAHPRTAHFSTLRAANPDPNEAQQAGSGMPPARFGGGRR